MHETPAPAPAPEPDTAAEWVGRLATELGVEPMTLRTQAALLAIARDVAHGAERKYAPLASFVAGRRVEAAVRAGRSVDDALAEVSEVVARLLDVPPSTA